MCGIAGIVSTGEPIPPELIEKMTVCLQHRGPDAQRCNSLSGCELGHRRLSIIDLSTGDQPMSDTTGRWWIVFNGEIYNFRELRSDLLSKQAQFRTQSDTEVVLQGFIHLGEDVVRHLNGQFAFAIWDNQEHVLFAARDRFGEKPFYWTDATAGDFFIFASEIKSLLETNLILPKLDHSAVDQYLALYHVPPDKTIYRNIFTLQPGHTLQWRAGQVETKRYWAPDFSGNETIGQQEAIEKLGILIRAAVHRQMVSDVPIGAFLSGGLDSSTVVALMAEFTSEPVRTFSVGFGELIDELPYAREVAQKYRTDHHEIQMDIPVGEMLERMSVVYDEPFADSSNIPTYLMAEFASQHVKVCLSGDGGDELFGGYSWYTPLLKRGNTVAAPLFQRVFQSSLRTASSILFRKSDDEWEQRLRIGTLLPIDRTALWQGNFSPDNTLDELRAMYKPGANLEGMDRASFFDVHCYLPGDILVKVDRAALAHGLESRAPFLDVELAEFVLSLPWRLRFKEPEKLKYLLRASSQMYWPETLRNRPKQGFGAPIERWIERDDVKSLSTRVLLPNSPLRELLPGLNEENYTNSPAAQKWTLLCLGLWLERHTDSL